MRVRGDGVDMRVLRLAVVLVVVLAFAGTAVAARQVPPSRSLNGSTVLDAVANDIVGADDMAVALEDDYVEWERFVGEGAEDVLGFVVLDEPPSELYHVVFLGPSTYPAWSAWLSTGSFAGNEYAFATAAMTLVHESLHWRMLSGDESAVNACALKYFPSYLARDFGVPETIAKTTTERVAVKTTKSVPVTKVVVKKKRVKVHGKWVTRTVRTTVTTRVPKTTTSYVERPVTTTVPNPAFATLVADSVDFYNRQPPPYNGGSCPS